MSGANLTPLQQNAIGIIQRHGRIIEGPFGVWHGAYSHNALVREGTARTLRRRGLAAIVGRRPRTMELTDLGFEVAFAASSRAQQSGGAP